MNSNLPIFMSFKLDFDKNKLVTFVADFIQNIVATFPCVANIQCNLYPYRIYYLHLSNILYLRGHSQTTLTYWTLFTNHLYYLYVYIFYPKP